jgi:hypothetical protein
MHKRTHSNSRKTSARTGRSPTSAALTYALRMGLRMSFAAGVLACGSHWAQGEAKEISLRTEARGISTTYSYGAPDRQLSTDAGLGMTGSPNTHNPLAYGVDKARNLIDPRGWPLTGSDFLPSHPVFSLHLVTAAVFTRLSASDAGGVGSTGSGKGGGGSNRGGAESGSHGGAPPRNDYSWRFGEKLSPYFRVCTCDMIAPVPFRLPGTRTRACAMACKCDDSAFGIGLYNTQRLLPFCSVAADTICPWQIRTISPSSPIGLPLPAQFTVSQIVGCRLLESRPWE